MNSPVYWHQLWLMKDITLLSTRMLAFLKEIKGILVMEWITGIQDKTPGNVTTAMMVTALITDIQVGKP